MGRSRGGLTTKIHALVDTNGLPITLKLSAGQAHDGKSAADMLDAPGGGQIMLADRAYDSDALRAALAHRGDWANIRSEQRRDGKEDVLTCRYRWSRYPSTIQNRPK